MTGRRLLVGDAAICPFVFANAYTNDITDGMIGSVVGGIIARGGMQQRQSAASLCQSLAMNLPAYSTGGNARPSPMGSRNASKMECAALPMPVRNTAPASGTGLLPLSRFLVIGGCFYNERNHRVGPITYAPGSEAPEAGTYEQLDVFRIPTGITEHIIRGERLPLAPQGYTWRKMANDRAAFGL